MVMVVRSEAELAERIAGAAGPLGIVGGGTRGVIVSGDPLSVAGLTGVSLYEPGALTLVAAAGTPVAEIETMLAKENQRLAFEPMDLRGLLGTSGEPTIGGVVAANVSGPRRIAVGAARDHTLGVRLVDGTGTVLKNGGRVMKNVTGYDLVKLMSGSYGSLGVLTEVSLKVLPDVEATSTVVLSGLDVQAAVSAMSQALGSPFEVTGAAHDVSARETYLRIEGFEASVVYRVGALSQALSAFGDAEVRHGADLWLGLRDVTAFHGASGDIWRVSCKPSDAPDLIDRAEAEDILLDWGGGLIWLRTAEAVDLRGRLGSFDGHATLMRGTGQPRFHPQAAGVEMLSKGLREKFDPRGILNQGLMG
jgi:glycolate oxidase FAD binding subunit